MKNIYTQDQIPQGILKYLSQLHSERVVRSFLRILENAWERNNNHRNL